MGFSTTAATGAAIVSTVRWMLTWGWDRSGTRTMITSMVAVASPTRAAFCRRIFMRSGESPVSRHICRLLTARRQSPQSTPGHAPTQRCRTGVHWRFHRLRLCPANHPVTHQFGNGQNHCPALGGLFRDMIHVFARHLAMAATWKRMMPAPTSRNREAGDA